ncbi:hypothetical protein [Demequina pelophila]|uniref:hypothetical protein n=1 Tax=Demequina pelophila TaxID=1638984 RepID=UPI0007822982|nr:hypothetical protein [Demequina pelophila]
MSRAALVAAAVAVFAVATLALAATQARTTYAAPISAAATVDLGTLGPGDVATGTAALDVPVDAVVTSSEWIELSGIARELDISAALCAADGCIDVTPGAAGQRVEAGGYTFTVTASLPRLASGTGTAVGLVTLMQAGELSATGGAVRWPLVALAVAALGAGGILAWSGRRRAERAP